MRGQRLKTLCLIPSIVLGLCVARPGFAQSDGGGDGSPPAPAPMGPEQFRGVLIEFAETLGHMNLPTNDLRDDIAGLAADEMQMLFDAFEGHEAFRDAVNRISARIHQANSTTATRAGQQTGERTAAGVLGINPSVAPFPPDYASDGFLDFLEGLGLVILDEKTRCSDDSVETFTLIFNIAKAAATVAQALCDALVVVLGEGTNVPACVAAGIANGVKDAAKFVLDACTEQSKRVNAAEIEAGYENTVLIFEGLRCVEVSQERMGQGCNGEDDNCDKEIDECAEDVFGPLVFIDQSVTKCCYDDAAEAAAAVALAAKAWDDCGTVTIGAPDVQGTECDVTVEVTATDDCGNSTTASTVVTIDGDGPSVSINPAVADVCYASIDAAEQAVLDATTIMDNCDSLEDLQINVHSSVTECALRVRLEVTDKCGNTTTVAITVRVDPHIPTVDIQVLRLGFRGEVLGFQTPVCYETIAEAEQAVLAVTYAEDNCTVSKELVTSVESAGDPCSLLVTSKAVDECGNENTDSETVRVDAEDPVVTCAVEIDRMSPPNHTMRNVGFTFTATDNCTGEPEIEIFITSDETTASADGAGQASPAPDAFILRDLDGVFQGILLRSERSTRGDGRVYEITVRATDECGNVGECSANVSVSPANGQPATDSGQFYDATEVN